MTRIEEAQVAAEKHLSACEEAQWDDAGNETDGEGSPAIAPFCGCTTCIVREVLFAAWPFLLEEAKADRHEELEGALSTISEMQPQILKTIERNGFVFTEIGTEPGNWQHLAFSLYTEICQIDTIARQALAGDVDAEQEDQPDRDSDEDENEVVQSEVHPPTVPPSPDGEAREALRELVACHDILNAGLVSFELHNETVERFEAAMAKGRALG